MRSKPVHTYSRRAFLAGMAALGAAELWRPLQSAAAMTAYQQTALFMGTIVRIDIASCPRQLAEEASAAAFAEGMRLESLLTRHRTDSPLGVLNSQGSLADVPAELSGLLDMSAGIYKLSGGAFDPTVLPVLDALERSVRSEAELARLREKIGFNKIARTGGIHIEDGMAITLDGIAKGYIAQRMSDVLTSKGCANHLVNAGGDIVARGQASFGTPWQIAVEDPAKHGGFPSVLRMTNRSLATSGVYERAFSADNGSHLIDPASAGKLGVLSASVLAPTGAQADALATAFSIMPSRQAIAIAERVHGVEAFIILSNGSILKTSGWPA